MVVLYMARKNKTPAAPDTLRWEGRVYKPGAMERCAREALTKAAICGLSLPWDKEPLIGQCYDPRRKLPIGHSAAPLF